jgi:hypothetical protein
MTTMVSSLYDEILRLVSDVASERERPEVATAFILAAIAKKYPAKTHGGWHASDSRARVEIYTHQTHGFDSVLDEPNKGLVLAEWHARAIARLEEDIAHATEVGPRTVRVFVETRVVR